METSESGPISGDCASKTSSPWQFEAHAENAINDLRIMWKEIGFTEEAQSENIEGIRKAVIRCFEGAVEEARKTVSEMRAEVESSTKTIGSLKIELGMPGDTSNDDLETMPLNGKVEYLREMVEALTKEKESWVEKIDAQRLKLVSLCQLLGKDIPTDFQNTGALNDARVTAFASLVRENEVELKNRTESVNRLIDEIRTFWDELGVEPSTELERRIAKYDVTDETTSLGLTMEVIEALSACAADFAEVKQKRLDEVRSLGAEITKLWTQLKVSSEEQDKFKSSHTGIGVQTVRACEKELLRLRKVKEERLDALIKELKATVGDLHDKVHAGPQQKEKYGLLLLKSASSKAELYDALELYISTLHKKLERLTPMLSSIKKWKALIAEREEYDQLIKDPSRLLSRRSGKELNRELKMAKRVTKVLPALSKKLQQRIVAWEKENDALWIDGRHFIDHMKHVEDEYAKASAAKKAEKKASRKKKFENDLRYGSQPERRPHRSSMRKSFAADGRKPKSRAGPLSSATNAKHRATVGGNVCRLKRRTNKEN